MTNTVEYLSSGLVLILIFSAISITLTWVLDPVYKAAARRETQSAADNLLTNLLGYSGYPAQWGSDLTVNGSDLRGLGLAKASKDDTALNLDIDKITRLTESGVGTYIDVDVIRRLANVEYRYDFNLKFIPVLNITINPTKFGTIQGKIFELAYDLTVMTHERIRVANVNLTGYILTSQLQGVNNSLVNYSLVAVKKTVTDWKGEASLNFTSEMLGLTDKTLVGAVLLVHGNYYGLRTMTIHNSQSSQDMLLATIVGDNLILSVQPEEVPKGAIQPQLQIVEGTLDCVAETSFEDTTDMVEGVAPWIINYSSRNYRVYHLSYMEPDIYFVGLVIKYSGKYWLMVALRIPHGEIGSPIPNAGEVANIRRLVLIDGYTYYADLHLWKVSW